VKPPASGLCGDELCNAKVVGVDWTFCKENGYCRGLDENNKDVPCACEATTTTTVKPQPGGEIWTGDLMGKWCGKSKSDNKAYSMEGMSYKWGVLQTLTGEKVTERSSRMVGSNASPEPLDTEQLSHDFTSSYFWCGEELCEPFPVGTVCTTYRNDKGEVEIKCPTLDVIMTLNNESACPTTDSVTTTTEKPVSEAIYTLDLEGEWCGAANNGQLYLMKGSQFKYGIMQSLRTLAADGSQVASGRLVGRRMPNTEVSAGELSYDFSWNYWCGAAQVGCNPYPEGTVCTTYRNDATKEIEIKCPTLSLILTKDGQCPALDRMLMI